MSDPKQLRFQFVVDEASLQKTRQLIRELSSDLAKLNELAGKAGSSGGGQNFGGVNVTGGGPRSTESQRVVAKTAPVGRQLVQNFLDQKDIFKGIADGSKDSLRVMTDSLKQAITYQRRELKDLDNAAKHLTETYDELGQKMKTWKGKAGMTAAIGAERSQVGLQHTQTQGERMVAAAELNRLEKMLPDGGGGGGFWASMTKNREIPGLASMMGKNTVLGSLAGGMGITPQMMGSAGLAAVGAWGLKNINNQVVNAPMFQGRADAMWGGAFGARGMDIHGGEFRNIAAENMLFRDPSKREDFQAMNGGLRRFGHGVGAFFRGDFNGAFSGRAADLGVQAAQEEMRQNERRSDPLRDQVMGEAQNYQGTLGMLRAMGTGPRQGETGFQALARIRAGFPGFDDGAIAGARGTLAGTGTRGAAWSMVGSVLHGEAAGINGLGGAAGTMSLFGSGRGHGGGVFANRIREMVGGGVDATTGGILASFLASQNQGLGMNLGAKRGDFQGSGLLDMISTGGVGIGGRLNVEQNIRGAGYMQSAMSGSTSPYQAARNVMIAMQSAPGLNPYGTSMLSHGMSLTELSDAASGKGGNANAIFKALGGTKAAAGSFFGGVNKSLLEGVSGRALAGTDAGRLMSALSGSGMDPRTFFQKGMYKKLGMSQDQAVAAYGGALKASDSNMDAGTAMGLARDITGAGSRAGRGKRAGDVAGGAPEIEMAAQHLKALNTEAINLTGAFKELVNATKNLSIRAQLEREGVDLKGRDTGDRERWNRAIEMSPQGAGRIEVSKIKAELDIADEMSHMSHTEAIRKFSRSGFSVNEFAKKHHVTFK